MVCIACGEEFVTTNPAITGLLVAMSHRDVAGAAPGGRSRCRGSAMTAPDIKRRLIAAIAERAAWRAGLGRAHAAHDPRSAASRDALHTLARDLAAVDDDDPRWRQLASLDLEDIVTRDFVGKCGFSDRGGAAAQDAEGFLNQLAQIMNITRDANGRR
jgi:hypothetical protein